MGGGSHWAEPIVDSLKAEQLLDDGGELGVLADRGGHRQGVDRRAAPLVLPAAAAGSVDA